jgi:pre-mRNA-splicing factor CWC22
MQSAVRLPTPEAPDGFTHPSFGSKRKRSPSARSPSPRRYRSPPRHGARSRSPKLTGLLPRDVDRARAMERQRQLDLRLRHQDAEVKPAKPLTAEEKEAVAKAEYEKLLNMRSGGTYIPPARLRALQAQITDRTSNEYQRMAWEALKKSINGLINKVNISNIKHIVPELFGENLIRGRGLFCRSIMKAQAASLPFTPIYAAMVAIVNTKLPQVGELLVHRLIVQFRKAFKRNDKAVCLSSTTFIAHLVNQQVVNEMLAAQMLLLLLHKPTDDSVEIAVGLTREVGQHLEEMSGPIALAVFDQFRNILHEADIDKRVQYMIEVLFQVRKDKYKDNLAIRPELDLVEEEDQITHRVGLDDELDVQDGLNVFKVDPEWQEHEDAYQKLKAEILGETDEIDEDDEDTEESLDDEEAEKERAMEIKDQTNTDLVNLRRTIYLTIKSSNAFEECVHKLLKLQLPAGQEGELTSMIIECASQERTYEKFYGLMAERFCRLNRLWLDLFEAAFAKYYDTIHRYEANRLRIIAQLFGHLLSSDAIGWHVLSVIHLNEDETTSSSRIFIKILFEKLVEEKGNKSLILATLAFQSISSPRLAWATLQKICVNISNLSPNPRSRLHLHPNLKATLQACHPTRVTAQGHDLRHLKGGGTTACLDRHHLSVENTLQNLEVHL